MYKCMEEWIVEMDTSDLQILYNRKELESTTEMLFEG